MGWKQSAPMGRFTSAHTEGPCCWVAVGFGRSEGCGYVSYTRRSVAWSNAAVLPPNQSCGVMSLPLFWGMPGACPCSVVLPGQDTPWDATTSPVCPWELRALGVTWLFWIIQLCLSNTWYSGRIKVGILIGIHKVPSVLGLYCNTQIKPELLSYITTRL